MKDENVYRAVLQVRETCLVWWCREPRSDVLYLDWEGDDLVVAPIINWYCETHVKAYRGQR